MNAGAEQDNGDGYVEIANVIRSNISLLLTPFKVVDNPGEIVEIMRSESFLKKFLSQTEEFSDRCCSQAAKITRKYTVLPEIRGMPTHELAKEIRTAVFESLDRPITGVRSLISELDNVAVMMKAGRIGNAAMRYQGMKLMRESQALIFRSIGEYLEEISAVTDQLLDFCCAKAFGDQISFEKQKSALESIQLDIHQRLDPIIQLVQAFSDVEKGESSVVEEKMDEDEVEEWQNDPTSPQLWKAFFKGFGVIVLILVALGFILGFLVQ